MKAKKTIFIFTPLMVTLLLVGGCVSSFDRKSPADKAVEEIRTIAIAPIPERNGQILHRRLSIALNPFGREEGRKYVLTVTLANSSRNFGDNARTIIAKANYTLRTNARNQEILAKGRAQGVANFNLSNTASVRKETARQAMENALIQVAESISLQLKSYFVTQAVEKDLKKDLEKAEREKTREEREKNPQSQNKNAS